MFLSMNRELTCILSLSLCFMLLYSAESTMTNMQKIIVSSISDDNPNFNVEGYTVTGVANTLFAVSLWIAPFSINALGTKLTMVLSAVACLGLVVPYLIEIDWMVYGEAIILGIASGFLWPANGHYIIENSTPQTVGRNVGIFWTILRTSDLWGNLVVLYKFHGKKYIDQTTRRSVLYFLLAINISAVVAFTALPKPVNDQTVNYSPIKTVKKCWVILTSYKMLLMLFTFSYTGLQQAFCSGIYSSSIGFTLAFGNSAKELVALSGILMSIGGIIGGICPIVFSGWIRSHRYGRRLLVLTGCAAQLVAYIITFINLPDSAVFGNTDQLGLITPSATLAMTGSVLLTFGDSCLNTQILSIIADLYRESSAEACAFYKFVKAIFISLNFYCCSHLGLHIQVAILATMAVAGVSCFFVADSDITIAPTEHKMSSQETPQTKK
uniref:UNC93-like protein MFSD11 n=1 Tax=Graphocephala atropunctata TaxID=36148 RepID=A0A1B6L9M9_9HEMI